MAQLISSLSPDFLLPRKRPSSRCSTSSGSMDSRWIWFLTGVLSSRLSSGKYSAPLLGRRPAYPPGSIPSRMDIRSKLSRTWRPP
jgi:hypothetical protein